MPVYTRMTARDVHEAHRSATPLELFFDLTFVVAVAQASASFHHALVERHFDDALLGFPLTFFAIWWAWMNFTWFASAYDTDDALYRLMVFVQMTGVLILAAGIPRAFDGSDFGVMTAGYVVMRLAMVAQWLRAAAAHPATRGAALRYAAGIAVVQVGWVARLALSERAGLLAFFVLAGLELLVPVWGESGGRTPWHPRHMAERYGLFTIIVLGESVFAATVGVQAALDADSPLADLLPVIIGGLLLVFSLWWIYFDMPTERVVEAAREAFAERMTASFGWGYGHYFIFAGAAATGAGLAIAVDQVTDHSALTDRQAGLAIAVPVVLYLLVTWLLHRPYKAPSAVNRYGVPVTGALVLASALTPEPVLISGVVVAALVVIAVAFDATRIAPEVAP
jgi:low temperature requirement protein LtrA